MDKIAKTTHRSKDISSNNDAGTTGYPQAKKKKKNLDTDLTPFTKINSKQVTDLNVKCKLLNF